MHPPHSIVMLASVLLGATFADASPGESTAASQSAASPSPRDPFSAYPDDVIECFGREPIQRVPLAALQVQGIIAGTASPRALVLHPDGTSHLVKVGTLIGKNLGQVTAITPKGVVVDEAYRDAFGVRMAVRTVLAVR